ncbi:uncharacterized protein [Ptychodera flava]|uniref:uncharacterized protein n=1 Tax=Ptychodera flava TaxID=63121 RepID=UPI00396A7EAD
MMASERRNLPQYSGHGHQIKLTDRVLTLALEQTGMDFARSYKRLNDVMHDTYSLIKTGESTARVKEYYDKWLPLLDRYYESESEFCAMLNEQGVIQCETLLHERREDIETFQSFVTDILKTPRVKAEPANAEHIVPVTQMRAHSRHSSSSVTRLQGVDRRKPNSKDSVALLKESNEMGWRMKELELQMKMALFEVKEMTAELKKEIKKVRRRNTRIPVYSDAETDCRRKCSLRYSNSISSRMTSLHSSRDNVNSIHTEPEITQSKCMMSPSCHGNEKIFSFTAKELHNLLKILSHEPPRREPDVFSGSVYDYPMWIDSFDALIERKTSIAADRLFYLDKYTSGEPKEAIRYLLLQDTDDAYRKAKKILADRYGNNIAVAQIYRKRIYDWPQIKNGDGEGLRKFAEYLQQCLYAMSTTRYLRVLHYPEEHEKILRKLPKYIANRWDRYVYKHMKSDDVDLHDDDDGGNPYASYPSFSKLCDFLTEEAKIVCGPAHRNTEDSIKKTDGEPTRGKQNAARSLKTDTHDSKQRPQPKQSSTSSKNTNKPCVVCKGQHNMESCDDYLKMTLNDREALVMSKGLCMSCLRWGHRRRDCRSKKVCSTCGKGHHTTLHNDSYNPRWKETRQEQSPQ